MKKAHVGSWVLGGSLVILLSVCVYFAVMIVRTKAHRPLKEIPLVTPPIEKVSPRQAHPPAAVVPSVRMPGTDELLKQAQEGYRGTVPNLSKIVEDELKNLSLGKILFNIPEEMKVGIKERVEVRIARTIAQNLSEGLRGRGVPQTEKIRVGTFMKVRLMGDNFDIRTLSDEEQLVAGEGFTEWAWDVVPLKYGIQLLLLTVTVRIKIPNYCEERKDYPVFERKIRVKVNLIYSTKEFVRKNWQFIAGTIFSSGIIGWIIRKRRKSKKR